MIGGIILGGESGSATILVRALGPSLPLGPGVKLADPMVELRNVNGAVVSSNDDWPDSPQMMEIGDTGIPPTNPKEAALFEILGPGAYTAIVFGQAGGTGVGLVEVYRLQQ